MSTIVAGDVVPATVNGHPTAVAVDRVSFGFIHTADWRIWWFGHPEHTDGTPLVPSLDRLHPHGADPQPFTPHHTLEVAA